MLAPLAIIYLVAATVALGAIVVGSKLLVRGVQGALRRGPVGLIIIVAVFTILYVVLLH